MALRPLEAQWGVRPCKPRQPARPSAAKAQAHAWAGAAIARLQACKARQVWGTVSEGTEASAAASPGGNGPRQAAAHTPAEGDGRGPGGRRHKKGHCFVRAVPWTSRHMRIKVQQGIAGGGRAPAHEHCCGQGQAVHVRTCSSCGTGTFCTLGQAPTPSHPAAQAQAARWARHPPRPAPPHLHRRVLGQLAAPLHLLPRVLLAPHDAHWHRDLLQHPTHGFSCCSAGHRL